MPTGLNGNFYLGHFAIILGQKWISAKLFSYFLYLSFDSSAILLFSSSVASLHCTVDDISSFCYLTCDNVRKF